MGNEIKKEAAPAGLASALFTRTQQRVLGILFGQPDRTFFATEIFDRAGGGRGAVQRELERLTSSGLVQITRVGNQKHFQANRNSPIFDELRSIVRKTVGLADPLREALRSLARKIDFAFVYGSVARSEDRAGSDIDLLVVGEELTLEQLFRRLDPAEKFLGRKISPSLYTPLEFARPVKSAFLKKVLAGPRIILIGSEDAVESP